MERFDYFTRAYWSDNKGKQMGLFWTSVFVSVFLGLVESYALVICPNGTLGSGGPEYAFAVFYAINLASLLVTAWGWRSEDEKDATWYFWAGEWLWFTSAVVSFITIVVSNFNQTVNPTNYNPVACPGYLQPAGTALVSVYQGSTWTGGVNTGHQLLAIVFFGFTGGVWLWLTYYLAQAYSADDLGSESIFESLYPKFLFDMTLLIITLAIQFVNLYTRVFTITGMGAGMAGVAEASVAFIILPIATVAFTVIVVEDAE